MASPRISIPAKHLFNGFRASQNTSRRSLARSMATEASLPNVTISQTYIDAHLDSAPTEPILKDDDVSSMIPPPPPPSSPLSHPASAHQPRQIIRNPFLTTTTATLHAFPSLEPTRFALYPSTHLLVPLRKDILHRAVIFEGDSKRSGTASTKWRDDVHGSGRKIRSQKGLGKARLGDKKSPMLEGGGVAHGPKPRDFSTELPAKVYDLAWRTALSYRYRKGELILVDGEVELDVHQDSRARFLRDLLRQNRLGRSDGRTLFVTKKQREGLFAALEDGEMGREGRATDVEGLDVKGLLELGRVVMEKSALDTILRNHQSDLASNVRLHTWDLG